MPNCVNLAKRTPARCQILVRHHDVVGVLANVLDVIRRAGINVQEVSNHVFEGAKAACCKIQLDQAPVARGARGDPFAHRRGDLRRSGGFARLRLLGLQALEDVGDDEIARHVDGRPQSPEEPVDREQERRGGERQAG